jgi:hypothetical protein
MRIEFHFSFGLAQITKPMKGAIMLSRPHYNPLPAGSAGLPA